MNNKKILSFMSVSPSSDLDLFRLKSKSLCLHVHEGGDVSHQDYFNLLKEWVDCLDGSSVESKKTAVECIKAALKSSDSHLNLSKLNLKTIPPLFVFSELSSLDLSYNKFSTCEPTDFLCCDQLEVLNLSHNNFSHFDQDSCISSSSITDLSLKGNFLDSLKEDYFLNLPKLCKLDLESNAISNLDSTVLLGLKNLKKLSLRRNNISDLPKDFFHNLPQLEALLLGHNELTSFECDADYSLFIGLYGNPLSFDESVKLLESMYLEKQSGKVFEVSIFIDADQSVRSVNNKTETPIQSSLLADYLRQLKDWVNSDDGTSFENKLIAQQKIMENLRTCRPDLSLVNMNLHSIPPLNYLSHLRYLFLSNNFISEIDSASFPANSPMRTLDLRKNRLSTFEPGVFERFPILDRLVLSENSINVLESHFFSDLKELTYLELNDCFISDIEADTFAYNSKLTSLFLRKNSLNNVSSLLWKDLSSLESLDLCWNSLLNFVWPSMNRAQPEIRLQGNLFSLDVVSDLNALQNMEGYCGPTYELSVFSHSSIPLSSIDFDSLETTLKLWGIKNPEETWGVILNESSEERRVFYNNLNIFLVRLYNEVGRLPDGSIPPQVSFHVSSVLECLQFHNFDKDMLDLICNQSYNAVSDCVDRIGVVLVWMSVYCKRCNAKKINDLEKVSYYDKQLSTIDRVIKFVEDVNDCQLVFDNKTSKFRPLSELMSDGVWDPFENRKIYYDERNKTMRYRVLFILNQEGNRFRTFNIGEQVEDVFLILNTIKDEGLTDIETIPMLYAGVASLRDHLRPAIDFLYHS